jgi:hypothetical protein
VDSDLSSGANLLSAAIGLLVQVAVPVALVLWGRSVAKKRGGRGWLLASYLPAVAAIASTVGVFFTIVGLIRAFGAVAHADPSSKATLLSEGIATAMWATALGVGASIVLYAASIVIFAVGELTARREPE